MEVAGYSEKLVIPEGVIKKGGGGRDENLFL
jgi:hypothetical protein